MQQHTVTQAGPPGVSRSIILLIPRGVSDLSTIDDSAFSRAPILLLTEHGFRLCRPCRASLCVPAFSVQLLQSQNQNSQDLLQETNTGEHGDRRYLHRKTLTGVEATALLSRQTTQHLRSEQRGVFTWVPTAVSLLRVEQP